MSVVMFVIIGETADILLRVVVPKYDSPLLRFEIFGPAWSKIVGQVPHTGLFELLIELLSENPLGSDENCDTHHLVIFWS